MNLGHGGPGLHGVSPGENFTRKENGDNSEEITSSSGKVGCMLLHLKINLTPNDPENDGKFIISLFQTRKRKLAQPPPRRDEGRRRRQQVEMSQLSATSPPFVSHLFQFQAPAWGHGGRVRVRGVQAGLSQHLGAQAPLIGILSDAYGEDVKGAAFRWSDAAKSRRL